ncbi:MAG: hypothetical protein HQM15_08465 [Deltaproteobacteria bacterium]|nr:hypothetical protein [Deltaproteobacteria bacterium]
MDLLNENRELKTLKKVIGQLEKASIPYMLTGSMALNFYGHPRATNDFDIVIEISEKDIKKMVTLFEQDSYISLEAVEAAISQESMFNIIDNESVFKIDFIIRKNDPLSLQQFKRRQVKEFSGIKLNVISPEDLILAKLHWSRESLSEIQQKDITNLMRVLSKKLDFIYLEKCAQYLGILEELKKFYVSI